MREVFGEAAPAKPAAWLNSVPVVDRIVREFFAFVLRGAEERGFMAKLTFETDRLNGLFLGDGPSQGFERGSWNAPDQLGEHLLVRLVLNGDTRKAVATAFMVFADRLLDVGAPASGEVGADWQQAVDRLVVELRSALVGVPQE